MIYMMRTIFASVLSVLLVSAAACGSPKAPNGEACEADTDCDVGACWQEIEGCHPFFGCSSFELVGGMCAASCTWFTEGTTDEKLQSDCSEGEQCLAIGDGPQICFQGCVSDEGCREDYICKPLEGFSTCLPPSDSARIIEDDLRVSANPSIKAL